MNTIYDEYYYKIYRWAIKKIHHKEDAEDLTNSVFLSIFEYFNKDSPIEKIENLIWKIAYNLWCTKAKEYMKRKNTTSLEPEDSFGYEINMLDKIVYKEIIDDLDHFSLTDNEKKSFQLYYISDLSIKEIGEKLSTKEANVKYYLYSARKKIKEGYHE